MVSRCSTLWTSISGLAWVTVTVSSSAPTGSSTSILAVKPPLRSTPSRTTVLKPGSVNVTE